MLECRDKAAAAERRPQAPLQHGAVAGDAVGTDLMMVGADDVMPC